MPAVTEIETVHSQPSASSRLSSCLSVKGVAIAFGLLWGGGVFCLGLMRLANPLYAAEFLDAVSSIYPGFHGARSFNDALVGGAYALVDGAAGGAIFAWLYNAISQFAG
jgi:hypothetical protein